KEHYSGTSMDKVNDNEKAQNVAKYIQEQQKIVDKRCMSRTKVLDYLLTLNTAISHAEQSSEGLRISQQVNQASNMILGTGDKGVTSTLKRQRDEIFERTLAVKEMLGRNAVSSSERDNRGNIV